jgi:hypothetical protein
MPDNTQAIAEHCQAKSNYGNFASVAFALAENFEKPIWRGHAADAKFEGIERI